MIVVTDPNLVQIIAFQTQSGASFTMKKISSINIQIMSPN